MCSIAVYFYELLPKRLIRDLLSNDFFSQNSDLPRFLNFTRPRGMRRRVQMSVICTRFARYLYSRKQSWIRFDCRSQNFGFHMIARSQTIAEDRTTHDHDRRITEACFRVIANNRRTFCDLRSAIVCDHM